MKPDSPLEPDSPPVRVADAWRPLLGDAVAESLGSAGGFSGAKFWRFATPTGDYCLRRWPQEHPSPERLSWIHAVLRHAQEHGFSALAQPILRCGGESFLYDRGFLWELSPWLPGQACYRQGPSRQRLRSAMQALAGFHGSVAPMPESGQYGPSPSLLNRLAMLDRLRRQRFRQIAAHLDQAPTPRFRHLASEIVELVSTILPFIEYELSHATGVEGALQPCLRDVWHDHVLFVKDEVTGLIDYGAMRIDSPAGDVARLLGSLVDDDDEGWRLGLSAYDSVRPLTREERSLVKAFDRSTVALGGLQWLNWCCLEGRWFDDWPAVEHRLAGFVQRLRYWVDHASPTIDAAGFGDLSSTQI